MIVDAHTHLLPERLARAIRGYFDQHLPEPMAMPYQAEAAIAELRAAGVDRCWTLPYAHKPGMASGLNRWMAETWAGHDLVEPGGTLHPEDDVERVLDEALGELKLLKLHCAVGRFMADDHRLEPLWRRISAEGQPVVVHAGHSPAGPTEAEELEPIRRVIARWPEARVIIAHCGSPAVKQTLEILRGSRSACADLTPVVYVPVQLSAAEVEGLEDRLLFGSDAPNTGIPIPDAIAHVRRLGLSADAQAKVLGGNAQRLLERR